MSVYEQTQRPWGVTESGEFTRGGVIVAFVAGLWAVIMCLPMAVLGVVISCMGLDRVTSDPKTARSYLRWSWIIFAAAPLGGALIIGTIRMIVG